MVQPFKQKGRRPLDRIRQNLKGDGVKSVIKVKNLSRTIKGSKILNNINLEMEGIIGIIGPNGAGKSTLMKIIAGVEIGDSGYSITFNDMERSGVSIGYLPQEFSIFPNLTVWDSLKVLVILKGGDINEIEELMNIMNLQDYKEKKMKQLSAGVYRRVGIAQALIDNPEYLIIDEPTAGLDIIECIKLRKILLEISSRVHIIISSHLPDDIELICNHIVVINEGEMKFEGPLNEMIQLSDGQIFSTIAEWQNQLFHEKLNDVIKVKRISKNKIEVKHFSQDIFMNDKKNTKRENEGTFLGSYILLTKGESK